MLSILTELVKCAFVEASSHTDPCSTKSEGPPSPTRTTTSTSMDPQPSSPTRHGGQCNSKHRPVAPLDVGFEKDAAEMPSSSKPPVQVGSTPRSFRAYNSLEAPDTPRSPFTPLTPRTPGGNLSRSLSSIDSVFQETLDFSEVKDALRAARCAAEKGYVRFGRPERDGVSGTYMIQSTSSDAVLGVFKPIDEEAGAAMNPHGANGDELVRILSRSASGFHRQSCAYKEAAAYVLDTDHFVGVPQTAVANCALEERFTRGAFQTFVSNVGDADDYGPGAFSTEAVQRIAAFDIRTVNHDRHGGNILVVADGPRQYGLKPIE